ncbi:TsoY family (seleno)protein [Thiomonas intermedia]|uniref:TsoY family (seleno)protein n=1 Tax=Thiomonas intermedia TaxID=926 RepID=UPI0009A4B769|nr:hypothetical protein [Thiomonas intermedia]
MLVNNLRERYSPMYFLAALGAGGLAVSFFIYPMFLLPHPDTPMVTFNHLWPILTSGDNPLLSALVGIDLAVIALFSILHFWLLAWNLREFRLFRQTEAYQKLLSSNAEISLMAVPLTLAMTINVAFVLGAVFVPNLWSVVEWMYPGAIAAFLAVGIYALRILGAYFTRLFVHAQFDFAENNSLAPMVSIFALAMIAVGLAAPGAMSHHREINAIAMVLSVFFASAAILLLVIKVVLGFDAILRHGIAPQAAGSLWILIPILTLLGITWVRWSMGLSHQFGNPHHPTDLLLFTSVIVSMQVLFGMIGYAVMKKLNYFADYAGGAKSNAGAFALICPGVAFFVFGMFFLNFGLVMPKLVGVGSWVYFLLMSPLVLVQFKTLQVYFRLFGKLLLKPGPHLAAA